MGGASPSDLASLIEGVARELLGEPNARLSSGRELRWGKRGCVVYWLYDETCFCPRHHGYVGISIDFKTRLSSHRAKRKNFKWLTLFRGSVGECSQYETNLRPKTGIGWNLRSGGAHGSIQSPESIEKLRRAKTGVRFSEAHIQALRDAIRPPRGPASAAQKEKMRAALLGHSVSEETRQKISKSKTGNVHHSTEIRARISAKLIGRPKSPETKARISQARLAQGPQISAKLKGRPVSPETRAKIAAKAQGRLHSPETKARMSQTKKAKGAQISVRLMGHLTSPETKARISQVKKARSAEISAKLKGRFVTPETRARISQGMSAFYAKKKDRHHE